MEDVIAEFLIKMIPLGLKKYRIDGNGPGFHIAEKFKKIYPNIIEIIRNPSIKVSGQKISFNEYVHTNQLKLLNKKCVKLLNDEMQIHHYTAWDVSYNAKSTLEYGHGDSAITNGYVLLPLNWNGGVNDIIISEIDKPETNNNITFKDKLNFYRKQFKKRNK